MTGSERTSSSLTDGCSERGKLNELDKTSVVQSDEAVYHIRKSEMDSTRRVAYSLHGWRCARVRRPNY